MGYIRGVHEHIRGTEMCALEYVPETNEPRGHLSVQETNEIIEVAGRVSLGPCKGHQSKGGMGGHLNKATTI